MSEVSELLTSIYNHLDSIESELRGQMERHIDHMLLCDGKVTLTVMIEPPDSGSVMAHCHVFAAIEGYPEPFDACVMGADEDRSTAIEEAGLVWVQMVAPLVLSCIHQREVLGAVQFTGREALGVREHSGFVGPMRMRAFDGDIDMAAFSDAWIFDYAHTMVPPQAVHMVKVTMGNLEHQGWSRDLEADSHVANYHDDLYTEIHARQRGLLTRYAVFFSPPAEVAFARQIDDAIIRFVAAVGPDCDIDVGIDALENASTPPEIVWSVFKFAEIALGRQLLGQMGVGFSHVYQMVHADGSTQDAHLMHNAAYARTLMLAHDLLTGPHQESAVALGCRSAEVNGINQVLESGVPKEELHNIKMSALFVLAPDADDAAMEKALETFHAQRNAERPQRKKPWWKFW
ncbi:MAG: hypothetical protein ACE366_01025 [Bradymonadia bacterium]